ncbi:MAG: thiamine ABC transporter permease [Bacillota bacterium]|nr:MAG: thiamine ABC transporter permease [Bacillota bacterium]
MLKRFFAYYKPHKKLFIVDTICAFLVSACNLVYPMIAKNIINVYVPDKKLQLLIVWCVVLLLIYAIKAILTYIVQYWGHLLGVRIQGDMRRAMFAHLQKLPFTYFDNNKTGVIMSRMVNDLFNISELAHHGPEDLFMSLISIVGAFVMLATINVYLTLIVFIFIPVLILFAVKNRKRMNESFMQMRKEEASINADIETTVSGVRVTKAYSSADYVQGRFDKANKGYQKARGRAYKAMGIFGSGMGFISDFLYLAVLLAGGLFFFYGYIDTGEFAAYILFIAMLLNPIRTIVTLYEEIQSGATGFKRFCEVMDEEPERDAPDAVTLGEIEGDIEFKNVEFAYEGKEEVLDNVSFSIPHGKTTALVGGSGGGKSTVCHLILHFYELNGGEITLDGINIAKISRESLREKIGIVAQDVFIFDGTVRENIAFGKANATDEEIEEAAKRANIHDFIVSLPEGYETWVGERGVQLSGGQRQRISIARAFLKNPPILILDEATSALDNITETQIQSSLNELSAGRTVVAVAHRLSTIRSADQIVVLERGKVVERGTHEELVAADGRYAEMLGEKVNG